MNLDKELNEIIAAYEFLIKGINKKAINNSVRAYGGIIRAGKGKFTESMAKELTLIAWELLGAEENRIVFSSKKIAIPIRKDYIENLKNIEIKNFLKENIENYFYKLKVDWHIFIDNKFVLAIECKSYTENAMLKRVLIDFQLLKFQYSELENFILFQLESQLGGDYSKLNEISLGSPSSHTLMSYFDVDVNIITLLEGERKVDKPIHKSEFYKPLIKSSLQRALNIIKDKLEPYV